MNSQERRTTIKVNIMTSYTKEVLEKVQDQTRKELSQAQLAIGEAAGRESDWHDNAAFDYANMQHDLKSAELASLNKKLRNVEIIEPRQQTDKADIGNTVVVKFEDAWEEEMFTILGPDDSGKKLGWLSYLSPLGQNLIGKKEGEVTEYTSQGERKQKLQLIKILPGNF